MQTPLSPEGNIFVRKKPSRMDMRGICPSPLSLLPYPLWSNGKRTSNKAMKGTL